MILGMSALPAWAAVTIEPRVAQQGYFRQTPCEALTEDAEHESSFDFCGCKADMGYPEITGGVDSPLIASRMNTQLKMLAPNTLCEGEPGQEDPEKGPSSFSSDYQVTLNDGPYLSILQTSENYYAGAAHGMSRLDAVTFQLPQGEVMLMPSVIDTSRLPDLNNYIYDYIIKNVYDGSLKEGDYWWSRLQEKRAHFVDENGCNECVFYLTEKEPKVAFQLYSVVAYAGGIVEIPIPLEFIADPALKAYYEGLR